MKDQEKPFYVYVHRRATDGRVFYVGKGQGNRATSKSRSNQYWHNIVKKHGFTAHIVMMFNREECAFSFERALIKFYGRENLCNHTDGGEGVSGMTHSNETRLKMSGPRPNADQWLRGKEIPDWLKEKLRAAKLGRKQSETHAEKSRKSKVGKKQPRDAVEYVMTFRRVKVVNDKGEVFCSVTDAAKYMSMRLGIKASQGNISMCLSGKRKTAYGHKWKYHK